MPTTITFLDYNNADSVGLPAISTPVTERKIMSSPLLARWWRADSGWDANNQRWRCRKTDAILTKAGTGLVSRSVSAAYNSQAVLTMAANASLTAPDMLPTGGGLSIVLIGRPGPNSNVYLVASATGVSVAPPTGLGHFASDSSPGNAAFTVNGGRVDLGIDGNRHAQGPFAYEASHDPVAGFLASRVWRPGQLLSEKPPAVSDVSTPATTANIHSNLILGDLGVGEEIAEFMVFNAALHLNPDLRAVVATYALARYALGV